MVPYRDQIAHLQCYRMDPALKLLDTFVKMRMTLGLRLLV
jgi:hypothetical protein